MSQEKAAEAIGKKNRTISDYKGVLLKYVDFCGSTD